MRTLVIAAMLVVAGPAWAQKPIVAMYGDSTTVGMTGTDATGYRVTARNEPAVLQEALPDAIVENYGKVGIACYELLNTGRDVTRNWWQEMAASGAAVVTINLGINDASRESEDFFTVCLGELVRIAQGYGKIVVLETPNPTVPNSANVQNYAAAMAGVALANDAFVIDQWTYDQNLQDWQAHLPDGIHPDDTLYAHKATAALCVIGPIVRMLAAP